MTIGLNNKDVSNNFDRKNFGRIVSLRLDWSGSKRMRGKKLKIISKGNFQRVLLYKKGSSSQCGDWGQEKVLFCFVTC